jgi:hypothetical protein
MPGCLYRSVIGEAQTEGRKRCFVAILQGRPDQQDPFGARTVVGVPKSQPPTRHTESDLRIPSANSHRTFVEVILTHESLKFRQPRLQ